LQAVIESGRKSSRKPLCDIYNDLRLIYMNLISLNVSSKKLATE